MRIEATGLHLTLRSRPVLVGLDFVAQHTRFSA